MEYCPRAASKRQSKETTTTPTRKPPPPADTRTHGAESSYILANHSELQRKQEKRNPQHYTAHPATAQGRSTDLPTTFTYRTLQDSLHACPAHAIDEKYNPLQPNSWPPKTPAPSLAHVLPGAHYIPHKGSTPTHHSSQAMTSSQQITISLKTNTPTTRAVITSHTRTFTTIYCCLKTSSLQCLAHPSQSSGFTWSATVSQLLSSATHIVATCTTVWLQAHPTLRALHRRAHIFYHAVLSHMHAFIPSTHGYPLAHALRPCTYPALSDIVVAAL